MNCTIMLREASIAPICACGSVLVMLWNNCLLLYCIRVRILCFT